ncbi:MAG: sigma-70 family RNA polymerase sigma factor [Bryobacteraceae bacterium]
MPEDKEPQAEEPDGDLTLMLNRMKDGDQQAGEEVVARVYDELHRIASREMRRERPGNTLQTTALIHEAYLRMAGARSLEIQNRSHFLAVASQQMRRVLVDHARAAGSQKRGGGAARLDLDSVRVGAADPDAQLVRLDDALNDLERLDPRPAKVVELKYFGGYSDREVAESLNLSLAMVRRDWEFARSWLFEQMSKPSRPEHHPPHVTGTSSTGS